MRRFYALVAFAAMLAADRLTKIWATRLPEPGPFSFGSILTTTHHHNFGLIANVPLPLLLIILIVLGVMGFVMYALVIADKHQKTVDLIALAFILAGAAGNLWDRVTLGYVFDWILVYQLSILNLADISVGLGLIFFIWSQTTKPRSLDTAQKIVQR